MTAEQLSRQEVVYLGFPSCRCFCVLREPPLYRFKQVFVDDSRNATINANIDDYINTCYEDDFENIETELNEYNFYYYHITIKPGYYEGFTLNIENNFPIAFDSWEDRREANKEITEIKGFLMNCAGLGLVACFPGWCTGYEDYKGTIAAIKAAIKDMREEVKTIPTWAQYEKAV